LLLAAALASGAVAFAAQPGGASSHTRGAHDAQTLKQKASYSLGVLMGTQLRQLGLTTQSVEFNEIAKGLHDVVKGTVKAGDADRQNVQALVLKTRATASVKNQAAAARFLAANAKRKGVVTTASGLQYRIVRPGSGAPPSPTDEVTVNYRGSLLDGTVFDSSYERGQPVTFPVNHVIKGWQEALVMMKPGAKWELYIPPGLAYGDDSPPPIPPGSLLKFDVELLSVKPASASPGGAGPNIGGGAQ
jgi:FKBP-type peptidyl-prolyl cis-trans isomerase